MSGNLSRRLAVIIAGLVSFAPVVTASAATSSPSDQMFQQGAQWPLVGAPASINVTAAWCLTTGAGVTIAELSTGADFHHPDLDGKLVAGASFLSGRGDVAHPDGSGATAVQDDSGTGTEVAGLMVAATNNRIGIAAVAPDAKALVVKVLDRNLSGYAADLVAAISFARGRGARVIYLHVGRGVVIQGDPGAVVEAIHAAVAAGVGVALPSDGGFLSGLNSPQTAQLDTDALVTGPLAADGRAASYSSPRPRVNIWAPGGDSHRGAAGDTRTLVTSTGLLSANPGGYDLAEGDYLAAAHAAGALALVIALGETGLAAHDRLVRLARSRNSLNELDLAAALGASRTCSAAPSPPAAGGASHQSGAAVASIPSAVPGADEAAVPAVTDAGPELVVNRPLPKSGASWLLPAAAAAGVVALVGLAAGLALRRRRRVHATISAEARRELRRW